MRLLPALAVAVLSAGCGIERSVQPVPHALAPTLCVQEDPEVVSKDFLETLCNELERHGVRTWVYQTDRPADCRYHVAYAAGWQPDGGSLRRLDIQVFDGDRVIGRATYDASDAWGDVRRFGSTQGKVRSLVDELMRKADPSSGPPTAR
jgi:hypothetical protein